MRSTTKTIGGTTLAANRRQPALAGVLVGLQPVQAGGEAAQLVGLRDRALLRAARERGGCLKRHCGGSPSAAAR